MPLLPMRAHGLRLQEQEHDRLDWKRMSRAQPAFAEAKPLRLTLSPSELNEDVWIDA
jgi:hypothetical protein